jgi:hypothetical protein
MAEIQPAAPEIQPEIQDVVVAEIPPVAPAAAGGSFKPKFLTSRELSNSVETVLRANVKLGEKDKVLMAKMYDKFRDRLGPALAAQDFDNLDAFFWIQFIGDMMILAKGFKVSGTEKKEIILETINLVVENEVPEEKREAIQRLIVTVVSPSIDLAIYFVHSIKPKCRSLFSKCGCCKGQAEA